MESQQRRKFEIWAGILLGIGLGGFFDGIVLHQILQWHHMLSDHGDYPVTTDAGLEVNTLRDGLFHATTYIAVIAGLALLWRGSRLPHSPWSTRLLIVRETPPRTARAKDVQQPIDDLAQINGTGPPAGVGRGQHRCEQSPLLVGQIGGVGLACHTQVYRGTPFSHTFLDMRCPVPWTNWAG